MIDLEKEYKAFENTWILLGASFKNFQRGSDNMYHLVGNIPELTNSEKSLTLSCINTALAMWLIQAKAKQSEIDELKAKLAQAVPGGFVVVPRIPTWEMVEAAEGNNGHIESIYRDMIEAAQGEGHE